MLSRLGSRYVWFDLFCIPQIDGDERQSIEIGRQTAIFRNSKRCVAWMNDCVSWETTKTALNWLGLRYLRSTTRSHVGVSYDEIDEDLASLAVRLSTGVELMHPGIDSGHLGYEEPVSWFSSMWTLQEVVPCPDMEICTRDWETPTDGMGAPISLTSLMIFQQETSLLCWLDSPINATSSLPNL
ncbi:hypothetical protein F4782DRAFT_444781 [Xylaria castorea]|nr:hypothetical protein F4782DRAFT_444781 [Xylaria castorea]